MSVLDLQNSLYETMKAFTEFGIEHSKATKTIECTIKEIINASTGEYLVDYQGNKISAFSGNGSTYKINEIVYVAVPDNDFEKNKIILGSALPSTDIYIDTIKSEENYVKISQNFINKELNIQLNSYSDFIHSDILLSDNFTLRTIINSYLSKSRFFMLSLDAKTSLEVEQRIKGDYGIFLNIPIIANDGTTLIKKVYLNTEKFLGNPYDLSEWSHQSIIFKIDDNYNYDISKDITLSYYCSGFKQDNTIKNYDIFLKNIELYSVKEESKVDFNGYSLDLLAEKEIVDDINDIIKIKAVLKIQGKIIDLKNKQNKIYWFIEDSKIKSGIEGYVTYGGNGWRCINTINENTEDVVEQEYITNNSEIEITGNKIKTLTRIKCVVITTNNHFSSILEMKNLNLVDKIILTDNNNGTNVFLNNGLITLRLYMYKQGLNYDDESIIDNFSFDILRYNKNNNLINDSTSIFTKNSNGTIVEYLINGNKVKCYMIDISCPSALIDEKNTLYCNGYYNEQLIDSINYEVYVKDNELYNLVINNKNFVYKYDANGNSPLSASYTGSISSKLDEVKNLSYNIYEENSKEILDYENVSYKWSIPKNSMFVLTEDISEEDDNNYYIIGTGKTDIQYKILSRYDFAKANNSTIKLEIKYKNYKTIEYTNLIFLKDGVSGTNGTSYSAYLTIGNKPEAPNKFYRYNEKELEVEKKIKYIIKNNDCLIYNEDAEELQSWENLAARHKRIIYPKVFKDGMEIDSSNYSVEYTMFGESYFSINNEGMIFLPNTINQDTGEKEPYDFSQDKINIIQAKILITSMEGSEILYAYYPIEIIKDFLGNLEYANVPDIAGGFAEVVYQSNGLNPTWDEASIFKIIYNSINENRIDIELSNNLYKSTLINNLEFNEFKVIPKSKYIGNIRGDFVGFTIANKIQYRKPIILSLNRFEFTNLNDWDGNKLEIDENGEYILAPQFGAGTKDNENKFTGVLMGEAVRGNNHLKGIIGYDKGAQSLFFDAETGGAIFGKVGSGRIVIDPQHGGLLYSENYYTQQNFDSKGFLRTINSYRNDDGMLIDLTNGILHLGNSGTSKENYGKGKIYSGSHSSLDSIAAGFYLGPDGLSIGENFVINSDEVDIKKNSKLGSWKINSDGNIVSFNNSGVFLDSKNSKIVLGSSSGSIYSGTHTSLTSTEKGFYLDNNGVSFGNNLRIQESSLLLGKLDSGSKKYWTVQGNNSDSYISYGVTAIYNEDDPVISADNSYNSSVYIGTNGVSIGKKFKVNQYGTLKANDATISGTIYANLGEIGGWNISSTGLYSTHNISQDNSVVTKFTGINIGGNVNAFYAGSDTMSGNDAPFRVTNEGALYSTNAHISGEIAATSGKIGNWHMIDGNLYNGLAYTGRGESNSTGMGDYGGNWAFWAGDGRFSVKQDGSFHAQQGDIAGWKLSSTTIYDNTTREAYCGMNKYGAGAAFWAGGSQLTGNEAPFRVFHGGEMYATNAHITGEITASSGKIGNWNIINGNLYNGLDYTGDENSDSTGMGDYGGNWAFWAGNGRFSVKQDGTLYASNANINGSITATSGSFSGSVYSEEGEIGGWKILENSLESNLSTTNGTKLSLIANDNCIKLRSAAYDVIVIDSIGIRLYDSIGNILANKGWYHLLS